jgi:hypothetical protein
MRFAASVAEMPYNKSATTVAVTRTAMNAASVPHGHRIGQSWKGSANEVLLPRNSGTCVLLTERTPGREAFPQVDAADAEIDTAFEGATIAARRSVDCSRNGSTNQRMSTLRVDTH